MSERDTRTRRDELSKLVHLRKWNRESTSSVLHCSTSRKGTKCTHLSNMIRAIFLTNISEDSVSSLIRKVDIDIWHSYARGIEKSLKKKSILQWIDISDT